MRYFFALFLTISLFSYKLTFAQSSTVLVLKGGVTNVTFSNEIEQFSCNKPNDYTISIENKKTLKIWSKNGIYNPQKAILKVSEGGKKHLLTLEYRSTGDFNATNYNFEANPNFEKVEKKGMLSQNNVLDIRPKAKSNLVQKTIKPERIEQKLPTSTAKVQVDSITYLKKLAQQKQWNNQLIEEKKLQKAEQNKVEIGKLDVIKKQSIEIDVAQKNEIISTTDTLKMKTATTQVKSKLQQQQEWNKELLTMKKKDSILEKKIEKNQFEQKNNLKIPNQSRKFSGNESQNEIANAITDHDSKQKKGVKFFQGLNDKKEGVRARMTDFIMKEKTGNLVENTPQLNEKISKIDTAVNYKTIFKNINFDEPPVGQYFDASHFHDTSIFYANSKLFLNNSVNDDLQRFNQVNDGIGFELEQVKIAGNSIYIIFKLKNESDYIFLQGATLLKLFDEKLGSSFQLNPSHVSEFLILAPHNHKSIVYVTPFNPNISASSLAVLSITERQTNKHVEFSFPGKLFTDALKNAMEK